MKKKDLKDLIEIGIQRFIQEERRDKKGKIIELITTGRKEELKRLLEKDIVLQELLDIIEKSSSPRQQQSKDKQK